MCRHYVLILWIIVVFLFLVLQAVSPLYFDHQVYIEGQKLAGKLGSDFE